MSESNLPDSKQLSEWIRRTRKKKKAKREYIRQADAGMLVEPVRHQIRDWPQSFGLGVDKLVLLPTGLGFESQLVTPSRVCIVFASDGMLNTIKRFQHTRMHIAVDTKMQLLARERGVVTCQLLTKGNRRNTSFHRTSHQSEGQTRVPRKKIQGKAFTTQGKPVIQAIIDEESTANHEDLFKALRYMWQVAKPNARPLEEIVMHVAKDFAPGIEAARKTIFMNSRPVNDFFHFMGKEVELSSKCKIQAVTTSGKHYKQHFDYIRSVLFDIQNTPTADMVNLVWQGFILRLLSMDEEHVAFHLWHTYSQVHTSGDLHSMGIFTNTKKNDESMYFLPWWGGFGIYPGFNCGSTNAEALHSSWQRELRNTGRHFDIPDTLQFMQQLYSQTWQHQFNWSEETPLTNDPRRRRSSTHRWKVSGRIGQVICVRFLADGPN